MAIITTNAASPDEQKRLQDAGRFLDGYVRAGVAFRVTVQRDAPADSAFGEARTTDEGRWSYQFANLLTSAADDHLLTVAGLLSSTVIAIPRYGCYTLLRGAVEADARACWLLDSAVSPKRRLGRGFTERLQSLLASKKLSKARRQHAERRIPRLEEAARLLSIAPKYAEIRQPDGTKRQGPLIAFGEARPNATALLDKLLPERSRIGRGLGAFTYQFLSGNLHAAPWALMFDAVPGERIDADTTMAITVVNVERLMSLVTVAVRVHDMALARIAQLAGGNRRTWDDHRGPVPNF